MNQDFSRRKLIKLQALLSLILIGPPFRGKFVSRRPTPSMAKFRTVQDSEAAEQLWRAVKGNGAFRYFKDTANRLGLLKPWYRYRDDALRTYVRDWAEAHQIPVIDDTNSNPKL